MHHGTGPVQAIDQDILLVYTGGIGLEHSGYIGVRGDLAGGKYFKGLEGLSFARVGRVNVKFLAG